MNNFKKEEIKVKVRLHTIEIKSDNVVKIRLGDGIIISVPEKELKYNIKDLTGKLVNLVFKPVKYLASLSEEEWSNRTEIWNKEKGTVVCMDITDRSSDHYNPFSHPLIYSIKKTKVELTSWIPVGTLCLVPNERKEISFEYYPDKVQYNFQVGMEYKIEIELLEEEE